MFVEDICLNEFERIPRFVQNTFGKNSDENSVSIDFFWDKVCFNLIVCDGSFFFLICKQRIIVSRSLNAQEITSFFERKNERFNSPENVKYT